jgi:acetyl/propionyl-CoA carboxylase alpha subunit
MRRALGEYVILGVKTSIPFHLRILEDPQVLAGQIHTQFLEAWLAKGLVEAKGSLAEIALVAGSLYLHTKKPSVPVSAGPGGPADAEVALDTARYADSDVSSSEFELATRPMKLNSEAGTLRSLTRNPKL